MVWYDVEQHIDDLLDITLIDADERTTRKLQHPWHRPIVVNDETEVQIYFNSKKYRLTEQEAAEFGISNVADTIEDFVIYHIGKYDAAFGCVAWVTSMPILTALQGMAAVSLVVQKEDFLRPDIGFRSSTEWRQRLRAAYNALPCPPDRYAPPFGGSIVSRLSYCSDPTVASVRCVGLSRGSATSPNMHHKFLVLCRKKFIEYENEYSGGTESIQTYVPETVITGSYNFTENSRRSFENVVVITNREIAQVYFDEYCQMLAISEPLDWTSKWVAPEWRIGS